MIKSIIYLTQVLIYNLFSSLPLVLSVFVFKNVSKDVKKNKFFAILRYILLRLRFVKHSGRAGKVKIKNILEQRSADYNLGCLYIFLILINVPCMLYPFSYDAAMYAAQKGDIQSADEKMRKVLVNAPDRADVLYDAGVLAHDLNNFNQAITYFMRAADCAHGDKNMQVRSYFNAGNSCVGINELHKALKFYDEALAIAPNDEYVRHNRERVAQMLQQEENKQDQQKENKKDQQNNEQGQDQDQSEGNDDEQNKNGDNQQKNDSSRNQSKDPHESGSHDEKTQEGSQKQSQKTDQGENAEQGDARKDGKQKGNKADRQNNRADKQKRDGDEELDEQSQKASDKTKKQKSKKHEKSPEKGNKADDKNSIASQAQQKQVGEDGASDLPNDTSLEKPVDAWLDSILNKQESYDKAMNKKLMEMRIREHGGSNAKNNW